MKEVVPLSTMATMMLRRPSLRRGYDDGFFGARFGLAGEGARPKGR